MSSNSGNVGSHKKQPEVSSEIMSSPKVNVGNILSHTRKSTVCVAWDSIPLEITQYNSNSLCKAEKG